MKSFYFLPIISCFFSFAQPVLHALDFPTSYSAQAHRASATGYSNGSSGMDQVWDFSTINLIPTTLYMSVVPSSSVPFSSIISEANYFYEFNDNGLFFYNMHNLNSESLEYLAYSETSSLSDYSSNSNIIFKFPYTYGMDYTDTYQLSSPSSSIRTVNRVYDAYGTLITPFGTFTNVIRQKTIASSGVPYYNWMTTEPFQIILQGNFEDDIVYFWKSNNLSTEDYKREYFSVFPNPTNGDFTIKNMNTFNKKAFVTIFNVLGNKVIENRVIEDDFQNLSLKEFSSGLYFVNISDENNQVIFSEKIIKK